MRPFLILSSFILSSLFILTSVQAFPFLGGKDLSSSYWSSPYMNSVQTISAQKPDHEAQAFIDKMGDEAIGFLEDAKLSQAQKEARFRNLLKTKFDLPTIGRFVMGKNWRNATPAQQKEYQKLFENLVVRVYAARFGEYNGQGFDVASSKNVGKKDIFVTSYITPDTGKKVQVDWRVRQKNGQYKIIDIVIEGVSMSVTQRSEFSSVIQRGGGDVEVLLAHLRK
ncbi:MAG: ABC transporter substrate-binding protein [Alphaproteobacteria bacterium]|nr:ABC transporter substrate-binding protein [Alphaproteobacteria bacterium]